MTVKFLQTIEITASVPDAIVTKPHELAAFAALRILDDASYGHIQMLSVHEKELKLLKTIQDPESLRIPHS